MFNALASVKRHSHPPVASVQTSAPPVLAIATVHSRLRTWKPSCAEPWGATPATWPNAAIPAMNPPSRPGMPCRFCKHHTQSTQETYSSTSRPVPLCTPMDCSASGSRLQMQHTTCGSRQTVQLLGGQHAHKSNFCSSMSVARAPAAVAGLNESGLCLVKAQN